MFFRFPLPVCGVFFVLLVCWSCRQQQAPGRDPAVFRINLDYMPRMLVFALSDELWAAYDVEYSRLYKTWKGGINFNGPMYDDRHNVQPSTRGITYSVDSIRQLPWRLVRGNKQLPAKVEYMGYKLKSNTATISYRIKIPQQPDVFVEETPGFTEGDHHSPVFARTFKISGLAAGIQLVLHTKQASLVSPESISVAGGAFVNSHTVKDSTGYVVEGDIFFNHSSETRITVNHKAVTLPRKPIAKHETNITKEESNSQSSSATEEGKRLIAMNDCGACHTVATKAIGPSFNMIAAKYSSTEEIVGKLAEKVIKGGTGVWGRQAMTPHPALSKEQAASMVSYILTLDSASAANKKFKTGLAANFFKPAIQLSRIPEFIPGQRPNLSVVAPDIEFVGVDMSINRERNDFFGFDDQFVMYLSGFMNINEPGKYEFRLKANAGARFILNGKKIADVNYSNYDYQEQEVSATLNEGPNSIRIEYYEDIYSANLSLRWRKPGEKQYKKIPEEIFCYDPADLQPSSPGIKEIYEVNAPGYGSAVDGLHPSFDVAIVRPQDFNRRLSDLEFLPDGSLAVATWDSTGSIYILEGVQGNDRSKIKAHLFAKGLYEVMGLEYVDGKLYALQKWELTELIDHDRDGVADEYRVALDDWTATANFHEWAFGLIYKDGFFYFNTGIGLGGNGILTDTGVRYIPRIQTKDRGKTIKVKKADWTFEAIAHGYKAPNGIGFGVDGEIFTTDNEGHMVPTNKLMHVPQTGYPFFGNDEVLQQLSQSAPPMKPPVLWMPESELSNSPSQPVYFDKGPFQQGQMVFGDVHQGGLHRVFVEKVNGEYQGAIFRFTQGLEAGITRLTWGPDGNLYMAGLGAGGDFGHHGECCGLQRLTYNGKSTLDMVSVKAKANGMEITFTEPLRAGDGVYPTDYNVQQFWYETADDVPEGGVKNDIENLKVKSVNLSADRRKVFLEIDGMKKEYVVYIDIHKPFVSEAGHRLWAGEAWYTLNNIPSEKGAVGRVKQRSPNTLLAEEKAAGWNLLFDGHSFDALRCRGNCGISGEAIILRDPGTTLLSSNTYDNFELEFDWKVKEGADAGVFYHLPAEIRSGQLVGSYPEMPIVDEEHANATEQIPSQLTGGVFNMIAPRYKISKRGEYNHSRIIVKDGHAAYWLNGFEVSAYDFNTDEWKEKWKTKFGKDPNAAMQGNLGFVIQQKSISLKNIRVRTL